MVPEISILLRRLIVELLPSTPFFILLQFELLNCTCDPNLFAIHYGDVVVVRAARPIERGEVLSHPNMQTYMCAPIDMRRNYYRTTAFYDCSCRACRENWPVELDLMSR